MNKTPRFLKEFAHYQISEARKLESLFPENTEIYEKVILTCQRVFRAYEKGFITINESMKLIASAFTDAAEGNT